MGGVPREHCYAARGPAGEPRLLPVANATFVSVRLLEQSVKHLERMADA